MPRKHSQQLNIWEIPMTGFIQSNNYFKPGLTQATFWNCYKHTLHHLKNSCFWFNIALAEIIPELVQFGLPSFLHQVKKQKQKQVWKQNNKERLQGLEYNSKGKVKALHVWGPGFKFHSPCPKMRGLSYLVWCSQAVLTQQWFSTSQSNNSVQKPEDSMLSRGYL